MLTARRQMDIAKKGSAYPKQCVLYISLRHGATETSLRAIFIRNQETASQRSPALDNVAVETAGNHISQPPIEEFADAL